MSKKKSSKKLSVSGKGPPKRAHSPRTKPAIKKAAPKKGNAEPRKPTDALSQSEGRRRKRRLTVVGLGASAGGLHAVNGFFDAMPADTGMAFVLIQHLDPTHKSLSAELIGRHTSMQVVQVEDQMCVEPNHVYVIPPNRYLTITDKTLHLTEPIERRGVRVPVDFFFRSLAQTHEERGIAIIFSGTGSDGTLGIREIKAAGGIVLVQSPETCQFDGMPKSAIGTGMVDYVLPVEKMSDVLVGYMRHQPAVAGGVAPTVAAKTAGEHLTTIIAIVRASLKHDFGPYKKGTLIRRIHRRMGLKHLDNIHDYVDYLRRDKDEVVAIYRDMLISVTNFFREPDTWQALTQTVIAPFVADCDASAVLRVWVPACATGEEAYSLAIVLLERLEMAGKATRAQIFASDIDERALAFARAGVYPENIVADVSPERLARFFTRETGGFAVNKQLREMVVFARQNVITDPPFSKLDIISCRNLLIYLEPAVQKKLISFFHFGLRPGGYLILGVSETIEQQHELFEPITRKSGIYRRIGESRPDNLAITATAPPEGLPSVEWARRLPDRQQRTTLLTQQIVLDHFVPACVLINSKAEVIYLHGPVERYLQLPVGAMASDLMAMAREGMRTKLHSIIRRAQQDGGTAVGTIPRLRIEERPCTVHITAEPVKHPRDSERLLLITFEEQRKHQDRGSSARSADAAFTNPPDGDSTDKTAVDKLEADLRFARGELQSTVEELQASNEEFQAANEEVMSVNEELQSTNEELETSKEELQTVNNQLEQKVDELETANNDLTNLLASTDIATIFLDREYRIKWFTPSTKRLLRVIQGDVGRPISDLAQNFIDSELLRDSEAVLKHLAPIEKEIEDAEGRVYLRRIFPYRTQDDRIGGIVVTFIDVTSRRDDARKLKELNVDLEQRAFQIQQHANELLEKQSLLEAMLDSTTEAVVVIDKDRRYLIFNAAAEELFAFRPAEDSAALWPAHLGEVMTTEMSPYPTDRLPSARTLRGEVVRDAELFVRNTKHPDGLWVRISSDPLKNEKGEIVGAVSIGHDVTAQRRLARDRARLDAIMRDTSAAIWIASLDGTVLAWNKGSELLLGYRAEEIVRRNVSAILPPERRDEFDRLQERLLRNYPTEAEETVHLHKNGRRVDVAITASLVDTGDNIEGLCVVAHDIGERKRVEHKIAALAESERQRIGHELHDSLGQQLTAIAMIVTAVKSQLSKSAPQNAAIGKLETLVEETKKQLRAVARGLVPVDLDACGLRVALMNLMAEVSQVPKIDCHIECPDTIALPDSFTATQLYLIAREAVYNALKHSKAGLIVVRVEEGERLRLSVEDNGVGIDSHIQSRGGMGLRLMRHRAGLIGATLRIEPADGSGTLVTCGLPQNAMTKMRAKQRES